MGVRHQGRSSNKWIRPLTVALAIFVLIFIPSRPSKTFIQCLTQNCTFIREKQCQMWSKAAGYSWLLYKHIIFVAYNRVCPIVLFSRHCLSLIVKEKAEDKIPILALSLKYHPQSAHLTSLRRFSDDVLRISLINPKYDTKNTTLNV